MAATAQSAAKELAPKAVRHTQTVARRRPTPETALDELQRLVRRPPGGDPEDIAGSFAIPDDLRDEGFNSITLLHDEQRALEACRQALADDLRFEYLKEREIDAATVRFVCRAHREDGDLASDFTREHAREVMERTCFLAVEHLTVDRERELFGVRFVPLANLDLPQWLFGRDPPPEVTTALAIESHGTNYERMKERSLPPARRALRLLRASLRDDNWIPDQQLRFRLREHFWFDDGANGWVTLPDQGWELELDDRLFERAAGHILATLPADPSTDVERRALRALYWFERAQLDVEPNVELLFLFFALESILGDKSEGPKAHGLALRRALLGLLASEGFSTHPSDIYALYDEVRSTAVHGERSPEVGRKNLDRFAWDVRRAINEFVRFARQRNYTKRSQVRNALLASDRRASVEAGLLRDHPKLWKPYLDKSSAIAPDSETAREYGRGV